MHREIVFKSAPAVSLDACIRPEDLCLVQKSESRAREQLLNTPCMRTCNKRNAAVVRGDERHCLLVVTYLVADYDLGVETASRDLDPLSPRLSRKHVKAKVSSLSCKCQLAPSVNDDSAERLMTAVPPPRRKHCGNRAQKRRLSDSGR